MKGFLVFLTVAIVAASATPYRPVVVEKSVITDAIALVRCITDSVENIQASVAGVVGSIGNIEQVIGSSGGRLDACFNIENPTIIEQIQIAECVASTAAEIRDDVTAAVDGIVASLNGLLGSIGELELCF